MIGYNKRYPFKLTGGLLLILLILISAFWSGQIHFVFKEFFGQYYTPNFFSSFIKILIGLATFLAVNYGLTLGLLKWGIKGKTDPIQIFSEYAITAIVSLVPLLVGSLLGMITAGALETILFGLYFISLIMLLVSPVYIYMRRAQNVTVKVDQFYAIAAYAVILAIVTGVAFSLLIDSFLKLIAPLIHFPF